MRRLRPIAEYRWILRKLAPLVSRVARRRIEADIQKINETGKLP